MPPGGGPPPPGPYAQARPCLDLIGEGLAKAGTSLEHVVRTRMYLTGAEHWEEVASSAIAMTGVTDPDLHALPEMPA